METPKERGLPNEDQERLTLVPPEEGYELYRHKDAESLKTKNWHGYYWARRNEARDYEIRSMHSSEGEPSVPGGVFPKEGFEKHYEQIAVDERRRYD